MASDISLTAGMRNNLLSLQNTVALLDRTQDRLATGKRVNSALDDPGAYFKSKALNDRSGDIGLLKDNMGQAIQTVQAADKGIKAITALVQQAKAIAEQAKMSAAGGADNDTEVGNYSAQLEELYRQIDNIASASGYAGVNLLKSNDLTVQFEGGAASKLVISGFSALATGDLSLSAISFSDAGGATAGTTTTVGTDVIVSTVIDDVITELNGALKELRSQAENLATNMSIVQTQITFTTDMQNVLTIGADKLTLADMNEEGANMLMLQTRQSLSTTALSLSAQAAQSVLRLFG